MEFFQKSKDDHLFHSVTSQKQGQGVFEWPRSVICSILTTCVRISAWSRMNRNERMVLLRQSYIYSSLVPICQPRFPFFWCQRRKAKNACRIVSGLAHFPILSRNALWLCKVSNLLSNVLWWWEQYLNLRVSYINIIWGAEKDECDLITWAASLRGPQHSSLLYFFDLEWKCTHTTASISSGCSLKRAESP